MIINVNSGSSGWGEYVLYGTKNKPRDRTKVEIIDGDIPLGDMICKNNKYKDSYYKFVLSFKGKPSNEILLNAYKDFKDNFLIGFNENEYHIDAVIHKDTDDYHMHVRIPKNNIYTNTHLQLYYDKIDRPRKEILQDYISLKYGFEIAREVTNTIFKDYDRYKHISKHRKEHNQKDLNLSNRKERKRVQEEINEYIAGMIKTNFINSRDDIQLLLEDLDLKVIKFSRDIKRNFAYVTVENDSGKLRIKGEIYDEEFF